jgi:DNA-binding SARP family transcriptional activator
LEIWGNHRVLPVTGQRQRNLIATLLLEPNRVVAWEPLVDAIWDDHPPATAKRQVQNLVSRLRKQWAGPDVPDDLVTADAIGYRIKAAPSEVDAEVFRQRLTEARGLIGLNEPVEALSILRSALRLWQGSALPGVPSRRARAAVNYLNELRLNAIEECANLELRLGRHRDVVCELSGLVIQNPLRERLVGQLMIALQLTGRRPEALATYHQLRQQLNEDLGLDPSPELVELHQNILAGSIDLSPALPCQCRDHNRRRQSA